MVELGPDVVEARRPPHPPPTPRPSSGEAPARAERRRDLRPVAALATVVLALSPLVWDLARTAGDLRRTYLPWGDDALLELNARDVLAGRQLLGPYSRFGWHHPGPAEALVLSLPVRLAGHGAGLALGSGLWNLAIAAVILTVVWRRHGTTAAVAASLAIGVVLAGGPPDTFRQPWNPYMVLLPMLLLLVLVGDVVGSSGVLARSAGDRATPRAWSRTGVPSLAWAGLVGTFCVQTHVSTAPTVAVLLALGFVCLVVAGRRGRRSNNASRGWWRRPSALLALGLTVALWTPPAWEAVTRHPGNPTLMARFFTAGNPGTPPREAVKASLLALSAFPYGFLPSAETSGRSRASLLGGVGLLLVLGLVALGVVRRRRSGAAAGLVGVVGVAAVIAVIGNTRITGGIHDYLVVWQESITGALLIAVGVALGRPRWESANARAPSSSAGPRRTSAPARAPAPLILGLVGILLATGVTAHNLRFVHRGHPAPLDSNPGVEAAVAAVSPVLGPQDRRVLLLIQDCDAWPAAAGLAVALEREGRAVAVDGARCSWGEFTVYFEEQRRRRGDETLEIEWALPPPQGHPLTTTPFPGTFINAVAGWRRLP
ncbi:MAG: hypothetical protein ABIS47_00555 [Acidimicrobiales bacterium]